MSYEGFSPAASQLQPTRTHCSPAPGLSPPLSDKVKPQYLCFPKASLPLLLKHKTSHTLHADQGKHKITQMLTTGKSFCILGKTHDQEVSAKTT